VAVALALEVLDRHLALRLRAAGDEEDRDAAGLGVVEDLERLLDRDPYDPARGAAVTVA